MKSFPEKLIEYGQLVKRGEHTLATIKGGELNRYVQTLEANQKPEEPFYDFGPQRMFYIPDGAKVKMMSDVECSRLWVGEEAELNPNGYVPKASKTPHIAGTVKYPPSNKPSLWQRLKEWWKDRSRRNYFKRDLSISDIEYARKCLKNWYWFRPWETKAEYHQRINGYRPSSPIYPCTVETAPGKEQKEI